MSCSRCFLRRVTRKGNFPFANPLKIMLSLRQSRFSSPLNLTWHRFVADGDFKHVYEVIWDDCGEKKLYREKLVFHVKLGDFVCAFSLKTC